LSLFIPDKELSGDNKLKEPAELMTAISQDAHQLETFRHAESRASITAIGGVEVVVKAMKTFPWYQALQVNACSSLVSLT
jgi:hypothetical protein